MIRTTVFCVLAVMAVGLFVSSAGTANSSSVLATSNSSPNSSTPSSSVLDPASSSLAILTSAFLTASASPASVLPSTRVLSSVHVTSIVATPTPSLTPISSPVLTSSLQPVHTSPVALVSPSPTVMPALETITIKNGNKTCLSALLDVTFTVQYNSTNKTDNTTTTKEAHIPLNGDRKHEIGGSCKNVTSNFNLTWNEQGKGRFRHVFSMYFANNITANEWTVTSIDVMFNTHDSYAFQNATKPAIHAKTNVSNIGAKDKTTYLCNSQTKIEIGNVTMLFHKLVLQPFSNETLKNKGHHCPADESSGDDDDDNTVPIAVGAALGGLVLIVLVAYIVGRRRSTRGYEQV